MTKIAIVGTGITGMLSAYILNKHGHEVTVFEKNDYIGGHTHTVDIFENDLAIPVDTGFIVFNEVTYPTLLKVFKDLGVEYQNTDMSFAISNRVSGLEYCGSTLNSLFCQRKNILDPSFYTLIWEIHKFNQNSLEVLSDPIYSDMTIREYFNARGIGKRCLEDYLLPMSVALWSAPQDVIEDYPIRSLINFFKNHGLLGFTTQFQWKTVKNGSFQYRNKLISSFRDKILTQTKVTKITRENNKVQVYNDQLKMEFDQIVLASHADQTLALLQNPTQLETELLSPFKYQKNIVNLHSDSSIMPKRKLGWAAWNHYFDGENAYVSYWMNKLQDLQTNTDYFISLNAELILDPDKILQRFEYEHPIFTLDTYIAQAQLRKLNLQNNNTYYCGSYFGSGFHEDGAKAAVEACKVILNKEDVL